MENEIIVEEGTDIVEQVAENCDEIKKSGGVIGKIVFGVAVVVTAGTVLLVKNRHKITEHQIRRLEKKGYVVTRPDEASEDSDNNEEEESE